MTTNNNPTPTDHAELRGLADSWPKPVRRFGDWSRGCREGQEECSSELDRLLTPALEELDRLRAKVAVQADGEAGYREGYRDVIREVSAERDALRAEVDLLKKELHAGDVIANHQSHEAAVVEVTDEMVERALNVWCIRETMSPSVAAIRIRMRDALLAAFGQPVRTACALEDGAKP